jgi:hypothetical protein
MDGFLLITAEFSLNTLLMAGIAKTHMTPIFNPLYFLTRKIFKLTQLLSVQNVKELNNLRKYLYVAEKIRNS